MKVLGDVVFWLLYCSVNVLQRLWVHAEVQIDKTPVVKHVCALPCPKSTLNYLQQLEEALGRNLLTILLVQYHGDVEIRLRPLEQAGCFFKRLYRSAQLLALIVKDPLAQENIVAYRDHIGRSQSLNIFVLHKGLLVVAEAKLSESQAAGQ